MTIELLALLTPIVGMGLQWFTGLCGETAVLSAIWSLLYTVSECIWKGDFDCEILQNSGIVSNKHY